MTDAPRIARRIFSRQGFLSLVVVILASALCISLGIWQWHRFEDKRESAEVIEGNYDATPVELDSVLPEQESGLDALDEWTQVTLSGEYCTSADCVTYVRNRPLSGDVGFWQLVPFVSDQGTVLVVRGWVPTMAAQAEPESEPPVPEGEAEIVVRLRPAEPVLENRSAPPGQAQSVAPTQVQDNLPADVGDVMHGAYGELATEDPVVDPMPRALEKPDTGLGPHLSYAFQWWIFAVFFPIGLVVLTRRTLADEDTLAEHDAPGREDPGRAEPGAAAGAAPLQQRPAAGSQRYRGRSKEQRGPRRRSQDEQEEDARVDEYTR